MPHGGRGPGTAAMLSADLVLGRDNYAMRFISAYREQAAKETD